ncbi:hypothetical protein R3P38DRAFT_3095630 [Favolaschia claudopus]|uniref:F-box domain-containing protein n=1 Tax=Favolaschia claudopus TaxID=2862362 RepID=A0AAV9ZQR1_9AGAR
MSEIFALLPRPSRSAVLQVSKVFMATAEATKTLWTDLDFGPASEEQDLVAAGQWMKRSGSLLLNVIIRRDPARVDHLNSPPLMRLGHILQIISLDPHRIRELTFQGPHTDAETVHDFLLMHSFPSLLSLTIKLETHWITIVNYGAPAVVTLAHPPLIFHASYNLVVFGPTGGIRAPPLQFKEALESSPNLERLGFIRELLGMDQQDLSGLTVVLPALTTLAFHNTPPSLLYQLLSAFDMANFTTILIALSTGDGQDGDHPTQLIATLHDPFIASRIRSLTIRSLAYPCEPSFFAPFTALQTLALDFSGSLPREYWTALADPACGGPERLPDLRNLQLVNVQPAQAQEIVMLRRNENQADLRCLELHLFRLDALHARRRQWSAWLQAKVSTFSIYDIADARTYRQNRGFFAL